MYYITKMQSPIYRQMTIEELLFGDNTNTMINPSESNTKTYVVDFINEDLRNKIKVSDLITKLKEFNLSTDDLRKVERSKLYDTFHIPKKKGGLRRIDAPNQELKDALRELKSILEDDFGLLYHTSAFAYIKKRSTVDAIKRHQANNSKWFGKYDLSNFFGNTTLEFVMRQFSMIFPVSEIVRIEAGRQELEKALELAFLNGGLPQGTPISPIITNIMMIPVDFALSKGLRDFGGQTFIYTRYADDFIISSQYGFKFRDVEAFLINTLKEFGAPFTLNAKKTRYGSSSGSNWNLGVMLNKDNQITVGREKKRRLQSMLHNYIVDKKNNVAWDIGDVMVMQGFYSYCKMIEPETIDAIIRHINTKMNVNVLGLIKEDLK